MKIKFTSTVQYENEGRRQGPIFEKDSEHVFTDDFAHKWLRRGVAVKTGDDQPKEGKPGKPEANPAAGLAIPAAPAANLGPGGVGAGVKVPAASKAPTA